MANLSTLPDELILRIVSYLPHDQLPALALLSKAFNRCSTNKLYKCVYFFERNPPGEPLHRNSLVPDWKSGYQHLGNPPSYATRIFDASLFYRTMSEHENLRSSVIGASFPMCIEQEDRVFPVVEMLQPSLSHLHLQCDLHSIRENRELVATADSLKVEFWEDNEAMDIDDGPPNEEHRQEIYWCFDLPNLKLLELSQVRDWDTFMAPSGDETHFSNITALSLVATVPADQGLARLLSWPKALKSLRYELTFCQAFDYLYFNGVGPDLSPKEFSDALRSQRTSLEELYIYGADNGEIDGFAPTEIIDLRDFTNLKTVGLPIKFLFITHAVAKYQDIQVPPSTAILDILPPAIEELQIKMKDWTISDGDFVNPEDYPDSPRGEVTAFLYQIVIHKKEMFKGLREIVLWSRKSGGAQKPMYLEEILRPEFYELFEACEEAGVRVTWQEGRLPPLFGLGRDEGE